MPFVGEVRSQKPNQKYYYFCFLDKMNSFLFTFNLTFTNFSTLQKNGTFIEAGAFDGETFSNTLNLEKEFGWSGLLIEPNPFQYQLLARKNRKAYLANCCLSLISRTSE